MESHLGTFRVSVTDWGGVGIVQLLARSGAVVQDDYIMGNRFGELVGFLGETGARAGRVAGGLCFVTRALYEGNARRLYEACLTFSDPLWLSPSFAPSFR